MRATSGLRISFLVIAVQFFTMLASNALLPAVGWPPERLDLLGQVILFSTAALVLFGHPGLRRYCVGELRIPIPDRSWPALLGATIANVSIPFAIVGAMAVQAFASDTLAQLPSRMPTMDPVAAWNATLSPPGLFRLVLLSWLVGPLIEELVFRGLVFRAFERDWGWLASMAATSVLFGLMHPSRFVATGLGSVILVCVLRRTGSLRACILVHAAFNAVVSWPILGQVLFSAPDGDGTSLSTWTLPVASLAFACVSLPACVWMARRARDAGGRSRPRA